MKKQYLTGLAVMAAGLFMGLVLAPAGTAYAEEAGTQVLSGEIGTLEIDPGVTKVILSGVTQKTGEELDLTGNAVLEIAEGTENTLGGLSTSGNLQITGSGDLTSGPIVSFGDLLVFDETGTITLKDGSICSLTGDIIFNSGDMTIETSEESVFPIMTYDGSVYVNGGSIDVTGVVGGFYAGTKIELNGGKVAADAGESAAFMAGRGETGSVTVSETFGLENGMYPAEGASDEEGVFVSTISTSDGKVASSTAGEGPDDTEAIRAAEERLGQAMTAETTAGTGETADPTPTEEAESSEAQVTDTPESSQVEETSSSEALAEPTEETASPTAEPTQAAEKKSGFSVLVIVLICLVGAAAAAAIGLGVSRKKAGNKKKRKGKK